MRIFSLLKLLAGLFFIQFYQNFGTIQSIKPLSQSYLCDLLIRYSEKVANADAITSYIQITKNNPSDGLKIAIKSICLFSFIQYNVVLAHELGHFFTGYALGSHPEKIMLLPGSYGLSMSGATFHKDPNKVGPLKRIIMLAAGPISGVAASFYILKYFFEKNNSSIFGIVSASVGLINNIINLLPHSTEVPGFGTVKNDGQQILENIQEIYTSFKNFVNQQ